MLKQAVPQTQITGHPTETNRLKRPVFYGRVSTVEQDKDNKEGKKKTSREIQTESPDPWLAYKKLPPLKDSDIFFDTATGTNTERPALERLMREVKHGLVSIVLVWKIDRFGRNVRDFLNLFYELEQHDVYFCSLTEGIDTSAGEMGKVFAKVMMTMLAAFGEWENQTRKDRLHGGRKKKVERDGDWNGGTPPFGYTLVAHKLVAVTEQAEIVQFIYKAYLEFKSISRVVLETKKEFARRDSEPPIKLDGRQIGRMLKNQVFTGQVYDKKKREALSEKKHDVIIDIEIFNRVQMLLKANYQGHTLAWSVRSPGFLFRDRAVCGHCASSMVAHHAPVNLKYYSCHLRRKGGAKACVHKRCHRWEEFEADGLARIIEHVNLIVGQPGYLEEKMSLMSLQEMNVLKKQIADRKAHLSKIEGYRERWRLAFEEREIDAKEMTARLKGFDEDSFRIEHEILELEMQIEDVLKNRADVNQAKQFAKEFEKNWEYATTEQRKDMINALVKRVRVFNDGRTEFDFNF